MGTNTILLSDLINHLEQTGQLVGYANVYSCINSAVSQVSYNSKDVRPGTLFVCKGIRFKEEYLREALDAGAICYIAQNEPFAGFDAPYVLVKDVRAALAYISAFYYGYKKDAVDICAVTGTKGKSTTVCFIYNIFKKAGISAAYSTTINLFDGVSAKAATLTTPESLELHALIHAARKNGCGNFIFEASSQSVKMKRIEGLHFKYGVFSNIDIDHIGPAEHKDFKEYLACKLHIVSRFEHAAINLDDAHAADALYAARNAQEICTYSIYEEKNARVYAHNIRKDGFRTYFDIVMPNVKISTYTKMPGIFNVSNALAGACIGYMMGLSPASIAEGVSDTSVPGRMEIFESGGRTVVVDYAHNQYSMTRVLDALKEYYPDKKIKVVFGCPGGKAESRRMDMAQACSRGADYVCITTEDPSYEDPRKIALEVKKFLDEYQVANEIVIDRKAAVRESILNTRPGELVLIAGKGSEQYQMVCGQDQPYEGDTALAKKYIAQLL